MSAAGGAEPVTPGLPLEIDGDAGESSAREKSAQAFRTISEVGDELDIPAHVLRFWETKFPQLNPMKRGGGRRYYRPADVALLKGIRVALYDQGLTIKGLQKLFRERGPRHIVALGEGVRADDMPETQPEAAPDRLQVLIADLVAVRDRLRRA